MNYEVPGGTCFGLHNVRRTNSFTSVSNSDTARWQQIEISLSLYPEEVYKKTSSHVLDRRTDVHYT